MRYSSISIPDQSVLSPFDTFDKLLSFCLFYENGEEWARHVLDQEGLKPSADSALIYQSFTGPDENQHKRTIEGQR